MWLLPAFSTLSRLATRTYFRLTVEGGRVPRMGPLLLVANHPNSLLDPALVAAAAGRPVRFLAKATLFDMPVIGWLVRGAGSIPVHRRQDDPTRMTQNVSAFAAAHAALAEGSAIGIFPEGLSHDEPSLAPLRTGAARIALESAGVIGSGFPIIPVGLVFREKETFRSEALILVGEPVQWDDLAASTADDRQGIAGLGESADPGAVRALTERIERALRRVTFNLESWEDAPLVETAYAIYAAEYGSDVTAIEQLGRLRVGVRRLAALRGSEDERWRETVREVMRHRRVLRRLGLTPADLHGEAGYRDVVVRAGRTLPFLTGLALAGGAIGSLLFWPPYRLIAVAESKLKPLPYARSTTKVLSGITFFGVWITLLALAVAFTYGRVAGGVVAVILPVAALATLRFHERWEEVRHEARRFLLKRTRGDRVAELRERQRRIAESIAELVDRERATVASQSDQANA
jgi:glycerol-3-phosphate O-acyltransferase / dihydroxyacetone phosphate acyltransferase